MSLEMLSLWYSALDAAPGVCGGRVRMRGTRITVELIREDLRAGLTPARLFEMFPHLTADQVFAAETCSTHVLKRIKIRGRR